MADEQLLDVRPALASIDKLNKAFESVSSYAQKFENAINSGVLNPLSKSLTSFEKTAKDADNLSKSFTTIAGSIHSAFEELNKVSAEGSAITQLKSMVKDLSEIGKIDSAGNFANLSKSFQQLGNGLSTLSNITANTGGLGNVLGSVKNVQSIFNKVRVVQSMSLVNSKGSKNDQISFIKNSIESVQEVSNTLQKFSGAVNNLQKTSDSITGGNVAESSKMAFGLIADLLNRINTFSYNIPVSKGNTDSYILFSKTSLDTIRSVNNTLSSFSKSIQELKSASSAITGEGVADSIETAFLVVSDIVNRVSLVTDSSTLRLNSNFEFSKASVEALDAIQKSLSAFAKAVQGLQNAAKGINNPNVIQQIEFSIAYIEDLFKRINIAWNPNTVGSGASTYSFSSKNVLDVKEIADTLNGMVKSFKSFPKVDNMQEYETSIQKALAIVTHMKQAAEPIRTLVTDLSGLSSMNVVPRVDKQGNVNYKLVESVDSKTKLFSNVVSAIKKMIPVVESLHGLKVDGVSAKLDDLSTSIPKLFESFSELGNKITIDDGSKNGKTMFSSNITNSFVNVVNVLKNFVKTITKLPELEKVGTFDFNGITTNIKSFIQEMGKLASSGDFYKFESLANSMYLVSNASKNLVTSTKKAKRAISETGKVANSSADSLNNITASFKQLFSAVVGGSVIYTVVRGFKDAFKAMADLEYQMRAVNTIARVSNKSLGEMTKQVMGLSSAWGVDKGDLAKALYEINSATIVGSDAMVVLEASVKAARAGFTDVAKTADIMSKIIKAYGYTAYDSAYISDVLFTTVERGINTMEQLSQYMGRVLTGAANAGVAFEEVAASIATMTTRGLQTNIATTALNSMILKLAGNSKKLNEVFQKYGYETSAVALRTLGLQKTIKILKDETQGHTDALAKLGFNYRDIRAATVLASDAIFEYNNILNMFNESANGASATQRAIVEVNETLVKKWQALKESVSNFIITIQEYFAASKTLKGVVDKVTGAVNFLNDAFKTSEALLTPMQEITVELTKAIGGLLLAAAGVSAILGLVKAIKALTAGFTALRGLIKLETVAIGQNTKAIYMNVGAHVAWQASQLAYTSFYSTLAGSVGKYTKSIIDLVKHLQTLQKASFLKHLLKMYDVFKVDPFSKGGFLKGFIVFIAKLKSYGAVIKGVIASLGAVKLAIGGIVSAALIALYTWDKIQRIKEENEEFARSHSISLQNGVQAQMSKQEFAVLATRKRLMQEFKNSVSKTPEEFNKAKEALLSFGQQVDSLVNSGKLMGATWAQMNGDIQKFVSNTANNPTRKLIDSFVQFDNVVKQNESSITKLIDKIAQINKTPVGKSFGAFEKYTKFADAQAGMRDVVDRMESKRAEFNALNVMSNGKNVTIDNAEAFLKGKGQANALSALNKHIEGIYTNLSGIIPDNIDVSAVKEAVKQLRLNPQSSTDIARSLYKRKPHLDTISKYGFSWSDQFGLSLKNKELQNRMGAKWDGTLSIESIVNSLKNYKAVDLMKDERNLQTSIMKMTAEYKKHAEEFAKQLPKILTEADKLAQGLFNAGKKSLTLPEQISKLHKNLSESTNIPFLMALSNTPLSAEEAGQAMRKLIKNTSKAELPQLLTDISAFTDLRKVQAQYKNALTKQKDALNKSLRNMNVDKMADPISYYRSQFDKAFANVKSMASSGKLDVDALNKFNEARDNYYNSLKGRASYQAAPAKGQTQAIRAGTQEAQNLLSRGVFANKYKTDEGILKSTKDVSEKTQKVADLVSQILAKIGSGSITIIN